MRLNRRKLRNILNEITETILTEEEEIDPSQFDDDDEEDFEINMGPSDQKSTMSAEEIEAEEAEIDNANMSRSERRQARRAARQAKRAERNREPVDDLPDGSDLEGVKPLSGNSYLITDPLTGEKKKMRGTEDEIKTYMAKQSMKADKQKRDKDFYDANRADDKEKPDPLRDRTSNYGGLSFDKFFKDILDGKKVIKYGTKAPPGSPTSKQIAAMQSLYNDMQFSGRKKKFEKIGVDGKFGPQTRDAIKDLQQFAKTMSGDFKNTTVDGKVGRQTVALFDPSKSPLPITGADITDAMKQGEQVNESVVANRWQILAGI